MTNKLIYLDNAAAMPINPTAYETLIASQKNDFANPTGTNRLSIALNKKIDQCRTDILHWLKASALYQLIFTSSATESNNTMIQGIHLQPGEQLFFSDADHPSQSVPCKAWESQGIKTKQIPLLKSGEINTEHLLDSLNSQTKLICLTHVNGLAGIYYDVAAIAKQIKHKQPNCHIHVDAAQGIGKMPLSLKDNDIDSLVISSYKLGGPKGIAALIIKKSAKIKPLLLGGPHEYGLRASTPATPLIFGFHKAVELSLQAREIHYEQVKQLNQIARILLAKSNQIEIPFSLDYTSPYFLLLLIPNIPADLISRLLEQKNIIVNTRTSCSAKDNKPTPMLTALQIDTAYHKNVIRVSLSYLLTEEDMRFFCQTLLEIVQQLSQLTK